MPLTLSQLKMIGLDELTNPLTIRFNLSASWGRTSQEITIDAPDLIDQVPASLVWAYKLWDLCIANAISHSCTLDLIELVTWKTWPLPSVGAGGGRSGHLTLPPAHRDESACVMMLTGHGDKWGRRRLFLPDIPRFWQINGVLTEVGMREVYNSVAPLFMATMGPEFDWLYRWLIAYPDIVEPDPSNVRGVAFRRVSHLRVCAYTAKPPDTVPLDWP